MSTSGGDNKELLSAVEQLFAKYWEEKDGFGREKTAEDRFWVTYLRAMKDEDEARPKDWDGNTGSILTFTGLFAATVAAFVIESYKSLSPDSGDRTVVLLGQLLVATTNSSSNSSTPTASVDTFHAPLPAVLANAFWFVSLVVALACALLATLVQQWSRDYVRDLKHRETLDESFASRALNHVYIRMGVDRYKMDDVVNLIVALVHLAVILFAAGLLLFLYPINTAVSACTTFALGIFVLLYLIAGTMPIKDANCPYRTPLTYPCTLGYSVYLHIRPRAKAFFHIMRTEAATQWLSGIYTSSINSIAFRLLKQAWPKSGSFPLFNSLSLPSGMNVVRTRRRRPRHVRVDMSLVHFRFVWQHTSRQLIDADTGSFGILLQSTIEVLRSMHPRDRIRRSECLNHLLGDITLAHRLDDLCRLQLRIRSPGSDMYVAALKLTCLILCRGYTKAETIGSYNEEYERIIAYYRLALIFVIRNPQWINGDAQSKLMVHLCLFHLRWSLLLLARDSPARSVREFDSLTFDKVFFTKDRTDVDVYPLFNKHELLGQPKAFLTLMNSWQYNSVDTFRPRLSHADWATDTASCLVPLHDDACCARRDGPLEHVAACTILTMITHLLRASEQDRDAMLQDQLWQYSQLWDHVLPFSRWDRDFEMSVQDRRRAPSPEFLAILREAGLERWIEVGEIQHLPSPETPMGRFLAFNADMVGGTLRTLAECVDMRAACSSLSGGLAWPSYSPSISPAATREEEGRQPALGYVSEEPISSHAVDELNADHSSHRGGSFDLERVVIHTVVGVTSSQLSRSNTIASDRSRDRVHACGRELLEANDPRSEGQYRPVEDVRTYPARADIAPTEHEAPASSVESSDAELLGVGSAEREEGSGDQAASTIDNSIGPGSEVGSEG